MTTPVVILVPSYRCEATITATLESIQEQGEVLDQVLEVLVADDGSRDRTPGIARSVWRSKTPLRILERQFNCGEYASVNSAVETFPADAEWFLIMHADNIAKPGWLKTLLDRVEKAPANVGSVCSSYDCFDDNGKMTTGEDEPGSRIVTVEGTAESVADTLNRGCWWHISSCAIRVSAYRQIGGLPKIMQLKGDLDFLVRMLAAGWSIDYIPKTLMLYRDNPAGSSSLTFRRHMDMWEAVLVIGRFRWALNDSALLRIHGRHLWFLTRRVAKAIVKLDFLRALWALPAAGCLLASYWSCAFDRSRPANQPNRAVIGIR